MLTGGTPLHVFELDRDTSNIVAVLISYTQNGRVLLRKRLQDCEMVGNKISTRLTQEDTLRFSEDYRVKIQIKVKLDTGEVIPSDVITKTVRQCLDMEVLE